MDDHASQDSDNYVPKEIEDFKNLDKDALDPTDLKNHNKTILGLELKDKNQKLEARKFFGWFLSGLLVVQNICIFGFLIWAYFKRDLSQYSTMISVVATATLAETAALVHTMVKWIFSDMEYPTR